MRNTIDRIENDLKEHKDKIKEQLNSGKAVDQKLKEILKLIVDTHSLQSEKKGKAIHNEETPVNRLQRKQPRIKNFELIIFGNSITKRIDPSFIARFSE